MEHRMKILLFVFLATLTFDLVVKATTIPPKLKATPSHHINITKSTDDHTKKSPDDSDSHSNNVILPHSNQPHPDLHSNNTHHYSNGTSNHTDEHGKQGHGNESHGDHHESHGIHVVSIQFEHVKTPLLVGLVIVIAGLSKVGFHHADFLSSKVPESCILILLGLICGAVVYAFDAEGEINFFEPHVFFLYLLPPIILEAAFSLHDRTFTDNLGSIVMFSVVGTVIACFTIGLSLYGLQKVGAMADTGADQVQMFVFSALIVAVDPVAVLAIFQEVGVNNMLYFMVFGESLLNDGVTVVLYNVMQKYNLMDTVEADQIVLGIVKFFVVVFGGLLVGVLTGLLSSFLTKYTNSVKVVEPIIIFGFAYESYIMAELFHFSGIISIIGCGLVQKQYAFKNITNKSRLACNFFAKVTSNTCEIIIFLFLGLETVHPRHVWNTGFTLWTTFLCITYRFIITFGISCLINKWDSYRVRKIKLDEMFMISYGGLRGAVCFSLVALLDKKDFPMKDMFVSTTLFVIFFTVFIQGGTIKWIVKKLRVSLQNNTKDMYMYQELNDHISDHMMAAIEEIIGISGKNFLRERFDRLDDNIIRPYLLRDSTKCDSTELNSYYEKLMMKEHYKNLQLCGATQLPRVPSSLRAVDSYNCLKVMDDSNEQEALERDEKIQEKRQRFSSSKSMKSCEAPTGGLDLHRLFRAALTTSENKSAFYFHDKNITSDSKRMMVSQLRNKYKKNQRLSMIRTPILQRAVSVDPAEVSRASDEADSPVKMRTNRAHTVDGALSAAELAVTREPRSAVSFGLEDTVFEEDEENVESDPLLLLTASAQNNNHKRVSFKQPTAEDSPDGRVKIDKNRPGTGTKKADTNSRGSPDGGMGSGTGMKSDDSNERDRNGTSSPTGADRLAQMGESIGSPYGCDLVRQDAIKDTDVALQELGHSKDGPDGDHTNDAPL